MKFSLGFLLSFLSEFPRIILDHHREHHTHLNPQALSSFPLMYRDVCLVRPLTAPILRYTVMTIGFTTLI